MKKNIKSLLSLMLLLLFLVGCGTGSELNRTIQIPTDGIIKKEVFEKIKQDDDIGIFNGNSNDVTYQWLFIGGSIIDPKDENLLMNFSDDNTETIKQELSAQYVQEFSFNTTTSVDGTPTLSVFFAEPWEVSNVEIYRYIGQQAILLEKASIVNSPNAIITFTPKEYDGIYYLVGTKEAPETIVPKNKENVSKDDKQTTPTPTVTPQEANETIYETEIEDESGMEIDAETGKDKYSTDPVPDGKPAPVNTEDQEIDKGKQYTATLSIDCLTIFDNMNMFNEDKMAVLPSNGIIMNTRTVTFYEGESVFDVLEREVKASGIHMEFSWTPIYGSVYVEGIHNIYEFDCGDLSGWMYQVNGWYPNYGASRYILKNGDVIEWRYTCDLGKDVGCDWDVSAG